MAITMDKADIEHFHHCQKFYCTDSRSFLNIHELLFGENKGTFGGGFAKDVVRK